MRARRVLLSLCVSLGTAFAAVDRAAAAKAPDPLDVTLPDPLFSVDYKQFCPQPGVTPDKKVLARAIVSSYKISLSLLEWNETGIGKEEYRMAVSAPLCLLPNKSDAQIAKCANTKDADAQGNISGDMNKYLDLGKAKGPIFNLVFKDGRVQAVYKDNAQLSSYQVRDKSKYIKPGQETATLAEQFFATSPTFYTLTCLAKADAGDAQAPPPSTPSGFPPPPQPISDGKTSPDALSPVRLRGTTADLAISRDQAADFKNASSAKIAITNDNEAHKNTFEGHMALGYAIPLTEKNGVDYQGIPYFKLDRSYVGGSGAPKTATNVDNVGFGFQQNILFPINGIYGNLAVQPDYTYSLRSDAKVGKVQFIYEAYPPLRWFGRTEPIGWMGLSSFFNARALFNIGRVFNPGTDTTLTDSTFTQAGVSASYTLSSDDSTSPFNGFSLPITYAYLYGFVGNYKAVQQLTIEVDYALTKFVSISASNTSGRNPDTFEKQNLYKLSLGVKY